tara:strand:- start:209 stop:391 length:183 start_codon:yes stop_codon:yes gene_type:complete
MSRRIMCRDTHGEELMPRRGMQIAARKKRLKGSMTPYQIAKGQELAAEYWKKYVVPFQKD